MNGEGQIVENKTSETVLETGKAWPSERKCLRLHFGTRMKVPEPWTAPRFGMDQVTFCHRQRLFESLILSLRLAAFKK